MRKIFFFVIISLFSVSSLFGQVTLTIPDVTGTSGTNVSVPINVSNFNNVGAISLKIGYDDSILTYVGIDSGAVSFTNNAVNQEVILGWFDFSGTTPLNLGSAKLVNLIFSYNGGTSNLTFNEGACEISDANGIPFADTYNNGSVSGGTPPALDAPTLTSPADGAVDQSLTPTLDWSDVSGATSYAVQVASDQSFTSLVVDQAGLGASTYGVPASTLSENTLYYWRANAYDGVVTSNWSAPFDFTTQAGTPPPTDISMTLENTGGYAGQPILVPLNVTNFNDVGAISLKIQFDDSALSFTGTQNTAVPLIANAVNGVLTLAWFDQTSTNPLNLGDSKLVDLEFNLISGSSNISFITAQCEISNSAGTPQTVVYFNGIVTELPPPPAVPILDSPSNGAIDQLLTPTLSWNSVVDALTYGVQLSTDSGFGTLIVDESGLSPTSFDVGAGLLDYGTTYYWRANATNANGTGDWSGGWSFTTDPGILGSPTLESPADGSTDVSLTPALNWSDVTDATLYNLQISTLPDFSNFTINVLFLPTSDYQVTAGQLEEGVTYYWRANAGVSDPARTSDWSTAWDFTTVLIPLPAPALVSPADGATDQNLELTLDWTDVAEATLYGVQVSPNQDFSNLTIDLSDLASSNHAVGSGVLDYATKYYWRAKASNDTKVSEWTAAWDFTTMNQPVDAPSLIAPADGATNQSLELTLDWNDVSGAATYGVQVATDDAFTNMVVNSGTVLNTSNYSILLGVLDFNTTYYWRANAASASETSDWSDSWSFTTLLDVGVNDLSGIPEEFELLQNYPNPFNPSTTIRYGIPEEAAVRISVINMLGEVVDELLNTHQSTGYYEIHWNANNISSGTYIYKIVAIGLNGAEFLQSKKMILLR